MAIAGEQDSGAMSADDPTPNPLEDVRKGLGLLFRAARTAVQRLPTERLEDVVATGAKEVGRALENVGRSLEKELRKATGTSPPPAPQHPQPHGTQPHGTQPQHTQPQHTQRAGEPTAEAAQDRAPEGERTVRVEVEAPPPEAAR